MRILSLLFLLLLSGSTFAQRTFLTYPGAGGIDNAAPRVEITSTASNPVLGASGTITATITFTKAVINFVQADITCSNCSLSAFTAQTQAIYTVVADPGADGDFSLQITANKCTDIRGIANEASNTLTYQLEGGGGVDYDLENATITISQHYRGHTASFTDCNDLLSTVSVHGMELLHTKNNVGITQFANGTNAFNKALYNFGRSDFGLISQDVPNFMASYGFVTDVMGGLPPTTMSYKNGITSYVGSIRDQVFYGRDSRYETQQTTLTYNYTSLTDINLNPRPVLFRWDYYAKASTDYYVGTQALGDTRLQSYVNTVISSNGWYADFVHWHFQEGDYADHYFEKLNEYIGSADVYKGDVSSVANYYYVREAVTSISAIDEHITVNHTPDFPSHPYTNIRTPLWVRLDVTGTNLAGREIALTSGNFRIRKISTNVFYVPILLNFSNPSTTVDLIATDAPDYVNLNPPVITRVGNSVTIDQPSKLTIFRVHKPTALASSSTSISIPTTDNTTVNMTVGTGLTIPANTTVKVSADATHWFYATVTSYTSGTGALVLSSGSGLQGTGTYASWSIERWYHMLTAEAIERKTDAFVTSYTIAATLDNANYEYWVGAINRDYISSASKDETSNIEDVVVTVNPGQYTDQDISITATPTGTVTSWKWKLIRVAMNTGTGNWDTTTVARSYVQNPTFSGITTRGFYNLLLTAQNSSDVYEKYIERPFMVFPPRFTEAQADVVINMATGGKFMDYRGVNMAGKKIYIKGSSTNAYLEFVDLHSDDPNNPVYIIKANDNTTLTWQSTSGQPRPIYFSQYSQNPADGSDVAGQVLGQGARHVIFNALNLDGTYGIRLTQINNNAIRVEGKMTDVGLYGFEIVGNPAIHASAIALVPTVGARFNYSNGTCNNLHLAYSKARDTGEEFAYFGESSQATSYIGNYGHTPPAGVGTVICWNDAERIGRDGIQVGCMGGHGHNNRIVDVGRIGDGTGQQAGIVSNDGSWMTWTKNYIAKCRMGVSIKSGLKPWSEAAGQSGPQPTVVAGNVISTYGYSNATSSEPFAVYISNNPDSGSGTWDVSFTNNTLDSDVKAVEFLLALGGFTGTMNMTNNIVIKNGNAGDYAEFNWTGNGDPSLRGTTTVNNIVRNAGSDLSDLYFTNYAGQDFKPTSLLSAAFSGSPTNLSSSPYVKYFYDMQGFKLGTPYYFGPYTLNGLRQITP